MELLFRCGLESFFLFALLYPFYDSVQYLLLFFPNDSRRHLPSITVQSMLVLTFSFI